MRFLQKYFLIALNVFRKIPYPKKRSEQTAWLSLLTVDNPEETKEEAAIEGAWNKTESAIMRSPFNSRENNLIWTCRQETEIQ